ncbi:Release factor glutamine methyltransferase [bioreactor metagenome]|uniref:Release factor glutamine methyltransferase n=1 Tax=bioreactor metagenome TaxID=1076179 RepID=A0A645J2G5_9ZZZZ
MEVAFINARNNNAEVAFFKSDLFLDIPKELKGSFDIIVSNPPYIPTDEIPRLMKEVSFEPFVALDGGEDGLYFYREIISKGKEYLKDGGAFMFETGFLQGEAVSDIFRSNGFCDIKIIDDMENRNRVVFAIYNN